MDPYEIGGTMAFVLAFISVTVIPFIAILLNIMSKINRKMQVKNVIKEDNILKEEKEFMQSKGPIEYK